MNNVKFIDYKPTPGEKHLGIATVLINDIVYLRYKIVTGKNGGFFPNAASYRFSEFGVETYLPAFVIESNFLKEQVEQAIRTGVNRIMHNQTSVANVQQHQMPQAQQQHVFNAPFQNDQVMVDSVVNDEIPF